MFRRCFRPEESNTSDGGERLSALLGEWKYIQPQANFEAPVRMRIHVRHELLAQLEYDRYHGVGGV